MENGERGREKKEWEWAQAHEELFKVVDGDEILVTKSIIWCFYSKSWMATAARIFAALVVYVVDTRLPACDGSLDEVRTAARKKIVLKHCSHRIRKCNASHFSCQSFLKQEGDRDEKKTHDQFEMQMRKSVAESVLRATFTSFRQLKSKDWEPYMWFSYELLLLLWVGILWLWIAFRLLIFPHSTGIFIRIQFHFICVFRLHYLLACRVCVCAR